MLRTFDDGQMWTKNTIDISIFHENKSNSNIYNNSYIKEYLEKVVKVKMQVSSISLPWLKNKSTDIMDAGTASQYSNTDDKKTALKWKKITDYTRDVSASYKALRNINNISNYIEATYPEYTRLNTKYSYGETFWTICIDPYGKLVWHWTTIIMGLRPVITK